MPGGKGKSDRLRVVFRQLGPYLSGQSGLNNGEALVRAPPYPFVDPADPTAAGGFGVLSRAVIGLEFIGAGAGAGAAAAAACVGSNMEVSLDLTPLNEIVCEIKLNRSKRGSETSAEDNDHVLRKTGRQIADLNVAIQASGEPNALVLRDLDDMGGGYGTEYQNSMAAKQEMLRDCVAAIIKGFPTAPELHAFLGWGPNGESETGTLVELKQRRVDLYKALTVARECQVNAVTRYTVASDAAAHAAEGAGQKGRQQLTRLKMSELRKRATASGIEAEQLAQFYDLDEPKAAIVDAIVKGWVRDPPSINRIFIKQPFRPLAVLVTGSRVAAVNGVYIQAGTYDGSWESFPYYNNGDRMILNWVDHDRRDNEPICPWRFQRTPGVRNTTAFSKWDGHLAAKHGLPIGSKRWWFYKPDPNENAESYAKDTENREAAGVSTVHRQSSPQLDFQVMGLRDCL